MKKIISIVCILFLISVAFSGIGISTRIETNETKIIVENNPVSKNIIDYNIINEGGYRVDWSHSLDLIAFDKKQKGGFYDVYVMNLMEQVKTLLLIE